MRKVQFKKGKLRAKGFWQGLTLKKNYMVDLVFDESCLEVEGDGWHKIIGRSTNGLFHHKNSMRLAWRPNKKLGMIEVAAYTYKDGKRQTEVQGFENHIVYVVPNHKVVVYFYQQEGEYRFDCYENDNEGLQNIVSLPAKKNSKIPWSFGVKLGPYVSSDIPAIKDYHYYIEVN